MAVPYGLVSLVWVTANLPPQAVFWQLEHYLVPAPAIGVAEQYLVTLELLI